MKNPKNDYTGQKFGRLTFLSYSHTDKKKAYWNFLCECGALCVKACTDVRSGNTSTCGCGSIIHYSMIGKRFGRLVVIGFSHFKQGAKKQTGVFDCLCDCGNTKKVSSKQLNCKTERRTTSCGCLTKEKRTTHGESRTDLHNSWLNMRNRCSPAKEGNPQFAAWYDKGIRVCEEWNDYTAFRDWSNANGYKKGLSLDRIDNDRNYCPENCRWVSLYDQQKNKTNVKLSQEIASAIRLEIKTNSVEELSEKYKVGPRAITNVLQNKTWTVDENGNPTPHAVRKKNIDYSSPVAGNIKLDNKWEVATAQWLDAQGLTWCRPRKKFPYYGPDNKKRNYTPDFWVEDWQTYIEVKGFEWPLDPYKWRDFPENLCVWKEKDLRERKIKV